MLVLLTTADTEILAAAHAVRDAARRLRAGPLREPVRRDRRRRVPRRPARGRARGRGPPARRAARVAGGRRRRCASAARATAWRCCCWAARPSPTPSWPSCRWRRRGRSGRRSSTSRHGGVENTANLLRFLADTLLLAGHGFAPPQALPELGVYVPGRGDVALDEALAATTRPADGRSRLLPLASRHGQHRVRRRAGGGDRRRRRQRRCACGPTRCARTPTGACPALELLDGARGRARHHRAGVRRRDGRRRARWRATGTGASGARTPWPASASRSCRRCARRRAARAGRRATPASRRWTPRCRSPSRSSTGASSACR